MSPSVFFRHCECAGILSLFDAVVVAAEVSKGKPAPDVFLKAAELLGVDPKKCRAYEDGESGIESVSTTSTTNVFPFEIIFVLGVSTKPPCLPLKTTPVSKYRHGELECTFSMYGKCAGIHSARPLRRQCMNNADVGRGSFSSWF